MSGPNTSHIPSELGGDLPEKERIAYEEGHDADIPSNEYPKTSINHTVPRTEGGDAVTKEIEVKGEKRDGSDDASGDGPPIDQDPEKQEASREGEGEGDGEKEPLDPNIVDWDGPNDPENPQNW